MKRQWTVTLIFVVLTFQKLKVIGRLSIFCKSSLGSVEYHRELQYQPLPNWTHQITDRDWTSNPIHLDARSFDKCNLCNFSFPNNISNSGPQDLVLSVLTGAPENVLTFVRTLRTTGCKCTCVLLADKGLVSKCTGTMNRLFSECGLYIINIGTVSNYYNEENLRFILYYKFMLQYHRQFERVILVDAHNTIFQTDPFTTDFDSNTLSISTECIMHDRCPWNSQWIYTLDEKANSTRGDYNKVPVMSGGLVWGSVPKIMGFLETFITSSWFATDETISVHNFPVEQTIIALLIHRNAFKKRGYDIKVEGSDHPIGAMFHCWYRRYFDSPNYPFMRKTKRKKVIWSVMHQYNRYTTVINYTHLVCPVDPSYAAYAYATPTQLDFYW